MKKDIVEIYEGNRHGKMKNEIQKITEFLKEDLTQNGTRIYMDGEEILFKRVKFQTDGGTNCREWIEEEGQEVDVSAMDDNELWSYIFGEYILNREISKIAGFGSTQVENY